MLKRYATDRNIPSLPQGPGASPEIGTVSIREVAATAAEYMMPSSGTGMEEFFMQVIYHLPSWVVTESFRSKYDRIEWLNREEG
ncbi:MAG: hypothetical protein R2744_08815 [Bacteroidales bacterium]